MTQAEANTKEWKRRRNLAWYEKVQQEFRERWPHYYVVGEWTVAELCGRMPGLFCTWQMPAHDEPMHPIYYDILKAVKLIEADYGVYPIVRFQYAHRA